MNAPRGVEHEVTPPLAEPVLDPAEEVVDGREIEFADEAKGTPVRTRLHVEYHSSSSVAFVCPMLCG